MSAPLRAQWAQRWAPPDPELASPVAYGVARSRGQFQRYRHVEAMEAAVLDCIANGGRLVLSAAVRHGKSQLVSKWLPAWYLGMNPEHRVILAAHEHDFAAQWGRAARDVLMEHGPADFGVKVSRRSEAAGRWDLERRAGGMLTCGVGGSPTGRGADLLLVDDPCRSYEDAMSPLRRQRLQEWWSGTMASRVEPGGAVVVVAARWHEDDLPGWLLSSGESWREYRLPAFADDEADPMGRAIGEPLWPERWPTAALEQRREDVSLSLGERVWLAQYQQRPAPPGGGMFPETKWAFMSGVDVPGKLRWVRAWDLAATHGGGDFTVGARMARLPDGRFIVADVVRGQWDSRRVRSEIEAAKVRDPDGTVIELPQDPGQAGKDQASQLVAMLAGANVKARPVTGSKEVRATGYASQQQAGNVVLVEAGWNGRYVAEHASFPRGTHDDIVDAAATAFNALAVDTAPRIRWL